MIALDDTRNRIIAAAIKAVRQYGMEGVRIQNVSGLAGISAGALYRYFDSKDQLLTECFTQIDKQAARIFEHLDFNPQTLRSDPLQSVKSLWMPYFRFWVMHPDETVFYHRFRDSAFFPAYNKSRDVSHFNTFAGMVQAFQNVFPKLKQINQDLLWLHILTSTVMYAKYTVEGTLPDDEETEDAIFQLLSFGLSCCLRAEK